MTVEFPAWLVYGGTGFLLAFAVMGLIVWNGVRQLR